MILFTNDFQSISIYKRSIDVTSFYVALFVPILLNLYKSEIEPLEHVSSPTAKSIDQL